MVGKGLLKKYRFEWKVLRFPPICLVVCHAKIIYFHSQLPDMSRACIHLDVHNYYVSIGVCYDLVDIAYQYVATKIPIAKKFSSCYGCEETIFG